MSCANLLEIQTRAQQGGYAVGAFNIFNQLSAQAVVEQCEAARSPVILQASVKTVKQIGGKALIGYLLPLAREAGVPVAIHLDHCKDVELAKACIDWGWTSVMLDASHLPLRDNIRLTKEVVDYAKSRGGKVSVEGELGAIGGVEEDIAVAEEDACLASVEDSVVYVRETGVDIFAPAVGTAHGVYKKAPKVSFERFGQIRQAVDTPLVVHGGTGLADDVFHKLIGLGASKINISTALKISYLSAVRDFAANHADVTEPLALDAAIVGAIRETARKHIALFGSEGKAEGGN